MFIQSIPGGKGVGMMYMIMYIIITVFIVGLMSGRTPEYLGMKITGRDVKLGNDRFSYSPNDHIDPNGDGVCFRSGVGDRGRRKLYRLHANSLGILLAPLLTTVLIS